MSDLLVELRNIAADGRIHKPTLYGNHCDVCGMRMPCDWAMAGQAASEAADEIERLHEVIASLDRRIDEYHDTILTLRRGDQ